jgi:phytoene synthase
LPSFAAAADSLGTPAGRLAYFGRHAKSFRFASRLFPSDALNRVSTVYAFCRFTDDLVDEAQGADPEALVDLLDSWRDLAFRAYEGESTGVAMVEAAMGDMRKNGVPFHYADDLISGIGMDIRPTSFPTLDSLRVYSYRVASTVGGWLTELFGVHDPWVLDRAFALGHAMQLTNILRDVGEDLDSGRVYLPADRMAAHGIDEELLRAKKTNGAPAFPGYRSLMEELMAVADADYARAFSGIPSLPREFRGPVAIAARVYQGIHDEIRRNRYDNLRSRARTGLSKKVFLALLGWRDLRRTPERAIHLSPSAPNPVSGASKEKGSEVAA